MLRIYNTLSRSVEEFRSITPNLVGIYSCGPTVYDYQHIGHMRRYAMDDILIRLLKADGFGVKHVMNITDVGHLVSDEDTGEDKMEKGARKLGVSVWEVANRFEKQFWDSMDAIGINKPNEVMHATDYIKEQIELIKTLEEKGYTYKIDDGIYFDTSKFSDYFKLSRQNPDELKKGARVEFVEGKKNAADFALWKFSPSTSSGLKREMEWESPWGVGFPGWHIECSAMSMKALGPHLDIHTGGIDHINIHHSNEIAQSECATGERFVNYWVHHNFLVVEGEKMSKSLGNFFTVQDVIERGYDPMALRYLYLQTHYRQEMNFTWDALDGAQKALEDLYRRATMFGAYLQTTDGDKEPSEKAQSAWEDFNAALNDDLNTSKALGILHNGLRNVENDSDQMFLMKKVDEIFGLDLQKKGIEKYQKEQSQVNKEIPQEIKDLVTERKRLKEAHDFTASDIIRDKLNSSGYEIQDTPLGTVVNKKNG